MQGILEHAAATLLHLAFPHGWALDVQPLAEGGEFRLTVCDPDSGVQIIKFIGATKEFLAESLVVSVLKILKQNDSLSGLEDMVLVSSNLPGQDIPHQNGGANGLVRRGNLFFRPRIEEAQPVSG